MGLVVLGLGLTAGVCLSQDEPSPQSAPAADQQGRASASRSSISAEELGRMLLDRPPVPVTEPQTGVATVKPRRDLPIDGTMVVDSRARLVPEPATGWFVLRFLPSEGASPPVPRRVLQGELLEQMEAVIAKDPDAIFWISGETTIYTQRCFLLPRKATVVDSGVVLATKATEQPHSPQAPADQPQTDTVSSEDIFKKLMADDPGRPLTGRSVRPNQRELQGESIAPLPGKAIIQAERTLVIDRVVRIVPERVGGWLVGRFESDNTLQEPPVRLLPCAMLTEAERLMTVGKGRFAKLKVSGEVSFYRGKGYLLLRSVMPERQMGQL